jgi:hypothetical protein
MDAAIDGQLAEIRAALDMIAEAPFELLRLLRAETEEELMRARKKHAALEHELRRRDELAQREAVG